MNENPSGSMDAAAALVIGGIVIIALPQHALSVIQIVIVTVSVVAGLYALVLNVPPTGWMSPFKWMSPFGRAIQRGGSGKGADEILSIHSMLSGWRQLLPYGPPMPPQALRLLRSLLRKTLDLDPENEAHLESARTVLSPLAWAVLTSDLQDQPYWFQMLPPNKREVAGAVHSVLDEIDRIAAGTELPAGPIDLKRP